jgi:hypothetical protein
MSLLAFTELKSPDLPCAEGRAEEIEPTSVDVDRLNRDFIVTLSSWNALAAQQTNGAGPDRVLRQLESIIMRLVALLDRFGDRHFGDRFVAALDAFEAGCEERLDSGHPESVRQIWIQACCRAELLLDGTRE